MCLVVVLVTVVRVCLLVVILAILLTLLVLLLVLLHRFLPHGFLAASKTRSVARLPCGSRICFKRG